MHVLIFTFFLFGATVLSASTTLRTSTTTRPTSTPASKAATPRVLKPATPPTSADIQNSITSWDTSVKTVNGYLNDPQNTTKLASAIVFARDEPTQLATVMKTTGLSTAGANAGKILMGNFPSIVSNLQGVQAGSMDIGSATMAINFDRCCTVLPNIGMLWKEAATVMKIGNVTMPVLEDQCASMSCASGVSGEVAGNETVAG